MAKDKHKLLCLFVLPWGPPFFSPCFLLFFSRRQAFFSSSRIRRRPDGARFHSDVSIKTNVFSLLR